MGIKYNGFDIKDIMYENTPIEKVMIGSQLLWKKQKQILPGPYKLLAGDMSAGFFGEVDVAELWDGVELANEIGLYVGNEKDTNNPWLKFAIDGKVIYKSKNTYRSSVKWADLNTLGCIYGEKTVEKNGVKYRVRVIRGGNNAPIDLTNITLSDIDMSEVNRLIYPITINAKTNTGWYDPTLVGMDGDYWGVDYTQEELSFKGSGAGTYNICQEVSSDGTQNMERGYRGASFVNGHDVGSGDFRRGWSPVLEVIE